MPFEITLTLDSALRPDGEPAVVQIKLSLLMVEPYRLDLPSNPTTDRCRF